jgi:ATP-binding cassette subfamily C protein CydCD
VKPFDPRLLRYSRSSRGFIFAIVLIAALGAVATITQAWILVDLICKLFQEKAAFSSLTGETLCLGGAFLARAILAFVSEQLGARASNKMREELRGGVLAKFLENGGVETQKLGSAGLAVLVTKGINNLDGYFAKFLPQLFIAAIVPLSVGTTIALRDWKSGTIILLTIPLIPIFGILIGRFTASATEKKWQTLGALSGYFLDLLSGLKTLKVYGREKVQSKKLQEVGDRYRVETMQVLRISFLSSLALELIATLSVALLAVTIGLRLVNGSIPLSTGLFILVLAPEVYWPIRQVSAYFHSASDGVEAFNQLFTILEEPSPSGSLPLPEITGVSWSELRITYPGREEVVIPAGAVKRGEVSAIIGPSGAGKSTLATLLLGFIQPTSGQVVAQTVAGGVDLSALDIKEWRTQIAWQPQEPKFPLGTVRQILQHAAHAATDSELIRALGEVDLEISDLPGGLETELGTLQQRLSIGQLRKIALARALLKKSPILILDEPTASIDNVSEATIGRILQREAQRGAIVILISHREQLVTSADSFTRVGTL